MPWAIIDTSVYIDHWERSLYDDELATVRKAFIVRQSSVVLSELRRGARTPDARRLVDRLFRLSPIQWAPLAGDWWETGEVIRRIGEGHRWDKTKRHTVQNDVLIALTARRHGATIVTANRADFDLLAREVNVSVLSV